VTIPMVDCDVSEAKSDKMRVVVADPDPLVRRGIFELLRNEPDIEIVGRVESIPGLRNVLAGERVDSVLVEFSLVQDTDFSLVTELRSEYPDCQVIVMGTLTDSDVILRLLRLGAAGYLPKRGKIAEFRWALLQVLVNMTPLLPDVSQQLLGHLIREERPVPTCPVTAKLSAREQEVLHCLTQGMCNKEIAAALKVSDRTVKAHVSNILRKLNVADRTQAVLKVLKTKGYGVT
jgi:DNA-binding NarL/FixJ family response regulator